MFSDLLNTVELGVVLRTISIKYSGLINSHLSNVHRLAGINFRHHGIEGLAQRVKFAALRQRLRK